MLAGAEGQLTRLGRLLLPQSGSEEADLGSHMRRWGLGGSLHVQPSGGSRSGRN